MVHDATTDRDVQALNQALADLFGRDPAPIHLGADVALSDDLVLCGILGGKDVGKSTLVNALALDNISVDRREVGKGTERPLVYVHRRAESAVRHRLEQVSRRAAIDIRLHDADAIRNAVLVDLPDFDSEFPDHLEIVRAIAPLLDRIIWLQTPRKVGDRAWVDMFRDVVKDRRNTLLVLNKVDELLADADPFGTERTGRGAKPQAARAFWDDQLGWFTRSLQPVVDVQPKADVFLVAAICRDPRCFTGRIAQRWGDPGWKSFDADRAAVETVAELACGDLDRLRSVVLSPVPAEQVVALKEANRASERAAAARRMRSHFDIDFALDRLRTIADPAYLQDLLRQSLTSELRADLANRTSAALRRDTSVADELLERRVERWPLLRLVYWPLGWLSRAVGRRLGSLAARYDAPSSPDATASLRTLQDGVELLRARLLTEHAPLVQQFRIEPEISPAGRMVAAAETALAAVPARFERELIDQIRMRDRRPSVPAKLFLWLVLLWFPVAQPILAGLAGIVSNTGELQLALAVYQVATALSATHLLAGFAVVAGIYLAILAGMHGRALRDVRAAMEESRRRGLLDEMIDQVLVERALHPLIRPFEQRLARLEKLAAEVDALASSPPRKMTDTLS